MRTRKKRDTVVHPMGQHNALHNIPVVKNARWT